MSLFEKYAGLYENTEFTAEERAEIGDFVVGLLKHAAANDKAALGHHFNKHFAYADGETLSKIGRVCFYFSKYGEPKEREVFDNLMVKEAQGIWSRILAALKGAPQQQPSLASRLGGALGSGVNSVGRNLGPLMMGLALTAQTAPILKASFDALTEGSRLKKSLQEILRNHPELRNDPNTAQYFQTLTTFAPSVATNPLVAGNILMRLHETGPSFVTAQYINELLGIQQAAGSEAPVTRQINEMAKSMISIAPKGEGPKKMELTGPRGMPLKLSLSGRVQR